MVQNISYNGFEPSHTLSACVYDTLAEVPGVSHYYARYGHAVLSAMVFRRVHISSTHTA